MNNESVFLKLFKIALLCVAVFYIALYACIALRRMSYPFELEWMEGGMLDHVARVLEGKPVYVKPSMEFISFLYAPLYYYVSAAAVKLSWFGFAPLRMVSFIFSAGCFVILYKFGKRETCSRLAGILAAGLFAATYSESGAWLDMARIDTMFLFLTLASAYAIRFHESRTGWMVAGALASLAFFTKQTALVTLAPLSVYALVINPRIAIYFILPTGVFITGGIWLLDYVNDGWFRYYAFELPRGHAIVREVYLTYWTHDMARPLWGAAIVTVALAVQIWRTRQWKTFLFYAMFLAGGIGSSWISRLHAGGYVNVLLPAYAAMAVSFGVGVGMIFNTELKHAILNMAIRVCVAMIAVAQFAALAYNPMRQLPSEEDGKFGEALVEKIASYPGDVLILYHGYLAVKAGKKSCAHQMAIWDLAQKGGKEYDDVVREFSAAVTSKRFSLIIMDREDDPILPEFYEPLGAVENNVFIPVTGAPHRPQYFFTPVAGG